LVLAAGLFMLSGLWTNEAVDEGDRTIVVSEAKIKTLARLWQKTRQRPPTRDELDGLIDDYVDEEVFYREAIKMGLDRDDIVIRRRLRQKLEFVAEDLADAVEPTDEQLRQFLDDHPDRFRVAWQATFSQVFLNVDRRGDSLNDDVVRLLDELRDRGDAVNIHELGDPMRMLPAHHEKLREREIAGLFGPEFASRLLIVEPGQWVGPIKSGYGVHLVLVHERTEGRVPELAEIRDVVKREWYGDRRAASKEDFYRGLREPYEVIIEMPATAEAKAEDAE
jgi:hypothetical protein